MCMSMYVHMCTCMCKCMHMHAQPVLPMIPCTFSRAHLESGVDYIFFATTHIGTLSRE